MIVKDLLRNLPNRVRTFASVNREVAKTYPDAVRVSKHNAAMSVADRVETKLGWTEGCGTDWNREFYGELFCLSVDEMEEFTQRVFEAGQHHAATLHTVLYGSGVMEIKK